MAKCGARLAGTPKWAELSRESISDFDVSVDGFAWESAEQSVGKSVKESIGESAGHNHPSRLGRRGQQKIEN